MLGIELNPYAAELARVSVWIGEIQWMRGNGFDAAKNLYPRDLSRRFECRDAVLNEDGTRAEWPEADVVIGNPAVSRWSRRSSESLVRTGVAKLQGGMARGAGRCRSGVLVRGRLGPDKAWLAETRRSGGN